ncbi:MAG: hypothetical protein ACHQWU_05955 [Gemmatimonadales bacterium]
MRITATLVAAAACLMAVPLVARPAAAQSSGDVTAYFALLSTPLGGLPPIATNTILDEPHNGAAFALRYGHVGGDDVTSAFNNFGATAVLPWGTMSTFSLTGGIAHTSFDDGFTSSSNNSLMLSAGADTRLGDWPLSAARDAAKIVFGVNGELGFAKPPGGTVWAGSVGLPISLVSSRRRRDEMRFVPYITPAFGFGDVSSDDTNRSDSGTRFLIGAGIAIYHRSNSVAVNAGLQYIPISGGHTQFGLGLVLGGR